jgi:hypothetical protein
MTTPRYRVLFVNSGVQELCVLLAAYVRHLRSFRGLARERIWKLNEQFFQFVRDFDPPAFGEPETYWSRVEEFLGFE